MQNTLGWLFVCISLCSGFDWPDNVTQHTGYITVNETHGGNLFYWLIGSRGDPQKDPLVVWLTGGPGCSSILALFSENGPFLINNKTKEPVYNPYGWNSHANLLYIDQPVGSGFSYVTHPHLYVFNEKEVASDLLTFMNLFYEKFPEYNQRDLYIFGESYAGHYIPATSALILKSNSIAARNLKGIGIGDGFVDPAVQYHAYGEFMYSQNLISEATYKTANLTSDICTGLIDTKVWILAVDECQIVMEGVLEAAEVKLKRSINPYDIRIPCGDSLLCYNFDDVTTFLNREDVQKAIGVNRTWQSCNMEVHLFMLGDWIASFQGDVADTLSAGVRVLVYNGKYDYICNYIGGHEWTSRMRWHGQTDFNKANTTVWTVDGTSAGTVQTAAGLTFLAVNNAGHLVPMDQPKNSLDMLDRFLTKQPF
ncbi:uncharacterized protein LOC134190856 [Corticium candelabrum]|uniref:uncharacterized protein LOC134190856 n=1 Tax=Corticium candelabrum TaxID=121492 RepID=UPI002E262383|nr:uncharacterized protein LOC134190856 [Corticium candelabrum]